VKSYCFVLHKIDDKTSKVLHTEGVSESIIFVSRLLRISLQPALILPLLII